MSKPAPIPPLPIGLATAAIVAWAAFCVLAVLAAATAHGEEVAPVAAPVDPMARLEVIVAGIVAAVMAVERILAAIRTSRERAAARAVVRAIEAEGDSDVAQRLKRTAAAEAAKRGAGATKALKRVVDLETKPDSGAQPGPARGGQA